MRIDFESKPVYGNNDDEKYIKTKIKIYAGSKKVPKKYKKKYLKKKYHSNVCQ